jgi:mannitol/fructose-specific phosphotransferase system IIA component (Ntr-type)
VAEASGCLTIPHWILVGPIAFERTFGETVKTKRAFSMNLGQFTELRLLVPRLFSEWRDGAISELSQRLESAGRVENASVFASAVLDHESLGSAVFDEVAFPLARSKTVKELSFALGLSSQGVRWGVGRTAIVHAVILFAVPPSEEQTYFSLVLTFARFLKDEKSFSALQYCTQSGQMLALLNHIRCVPTGPGPPMA